MTRAKRKLTVVDGNIDISQPPSKRKSVDSLRGKENAGQDYASMTKDELATLLRGRGLPYSGTKETLNRRVQEDDEKTSPVDASEESSAEGTGAATSVADEFEYCTLCRPMWDIREEKRATDEDYDSEEDEGDEPEDEENPEGESGRHNESEGITPNGQRKSICGQKKCICKLPASENPEHKWLLTKQGYLMVAKLQYEVAIRDQDAIGEHFYSDFNGYGFQEVMENQLLAFNREVSKKTVQPAALWSFIEAFAWILDDTPVWFHVDDPDTVLATLRMIGGAIFTTLKVLEEHDLLGPESAVKNIALVLGVLYDRTGGWPGDQESQLEWREAMIKEAKHHGIVFQDAPYTMSTLLERDGLSGPQNGKGYSKWKNFKWLKEFTTFHRKQRKGSGPGATIGGRHYALETRQELEEARQAYNSWGYFGPDTSDYSDDEDGAILDYVGK
ncbi:hypothetical protein PV04_03090 [Phialophora macrospora]|uniref:SAP domain-containing protein n=1 Tax=Phialophora macrospora TaxID=1851006 RepID=A0A0D2E964_9EURO|nr:hypothetical protein PV04_03090 [Phialophora macrospora]